MDHCFCIASCNGLGFSQQNNQPNNPRSKFLNGMCPPQLSGFPSNKMVSVPTHQIFSPRKAIKKYMHFAAQSIAFYDHLFFLNLRIQPPSIHIWQRHRLRVAPKIKLSRWSPAWLFIPMITPRKINMEPKNHPFAKGKSCSKPPLCSMFIFQGVFVGLFKNWLSLL